MAMTDTAETDTAAPTAPAWLTSALGDKLRRGADTVPTAEAFSQAQ